MNLLQKDKQYIGRDVPATPMEIVGAKGNYLMARDGRKYIDFVMGWCVGNIGWGVPEVEEEIKEYDGPDYVNPFYLYKPWVDLAQLLAKITPGKVVKSFRTTGGTESVEVALQAAMTYTKRTKFISIEGSYHGHSIAAMSVGMSYFREKYTNLLPGCEKINPPLNEKAALEVEKLLSHRDVAAYISEPIICNLGVVMPDQEYFDIVAGACKKYGTVFIVDEVASGFGRTGKLFASEWYKLEPDILTLGKGLTGGYAALGAAIMTEEIAKSMEFNFSFYSTFGWHPRNTVAALANLRYFIKKKQTILSHVRTMGSYFENRLRSMNSRYPTEVRAKGLAIGLESKQHGYMIDVMSRCIAKGLLVSELGSFILTIFPALTLDQKTAKEGLDIFESCL
ncbi:aminotransferase [Candidatus Gottesmanbacteria bacterium RIFCSPLOWO2_01_FULL_49_10]|uniref:Aminotransferase n=1 Tax=Candidatus Gottesmanbacteria bacterium RIFCSPLOWO2_01_FULL_49_10 TaxID=1798396 RepID=A0A1F6AZ41_9BACT|nr:MAG: aminotransferase [Candidatus Gottesmanbacteria bacterium RIFCSPLOWO2_01_FULL_49_10]